MSPQLVPASPLWLLAAGLGGGWQTGSLICTFLPLDTFNFLQMPATPATICFIHIYISRYQTSGSIMYLFIYYLFYILIYTGLECFCRHWHWHHHHYQHILCVQWIMNCIVTESRGRVLFIISISWIKYTFGQNILGLMFTPATRSSEYFVTTVTGSCWCWANHGTVILWPKYSNNKLNKREPLKL